MECEPMLHSLLVAALRCRKSAAAPLSNPLLTHDPHVPTGSSFFQSSNPFSSHLRPTCTRMQTEWKLLLTGTPIQNNLMELFSILNLLNPNEHPDIETFQVGAASVGAAFVGAACIRGPAHGCVCTEPVHRHHHPHSTHDPSLPQASHLHSHLPTLFSSLMNIHPLRRNFLLLPPSFPRSHTLCVLQCYTGALW